MKGKVGYAILNIVLALFFIFIAMAVGAGVAVLLGLAAFVLILYGVYAIFEYGIGAGIVIILIGVGLNGLNASNKGQTIAPYVVSVVIVLFAFYCLSKIGSHRTKLSKVLGALYPIAMLIGAYSFSFNPGYEDLLFLASALWIIATIIDVVKWDGSSSAPRKRAPAGSRRQQSSAPSRSYSSGSDSSVRYCTQGDVDRAMQKVASRFSKDDTISTGRSTLWIRVKTTVSVWTPNINFQIDVDVYNVGCLADDGEVSCVQRELKRKMEEYSSNIMDEAERVFSGLVVKEDYNVNIKVGKVDAHD